MATRRRFHGSRAVVLPGLLLVGAYVGCFPDLDALSAGEDDPTAGGTTGSGGSGATGGSGQTGGSAGEETGGTGDTTSGGTSSGAAGDENGGNAGETGTGGNGGAGAEGGECSTDTDIGKPDGNTVTDCGACGVTCSLRNASGSICADGVCEPTCQTGHSDCNPGEANDGCETAITTAVNCGDCGIACSLENVGTANCNAGACVPTCRSGFADCNVGTTNDGCEQDINTPTNCGACGYTCSTQQAVGTSCNAGRCAPTCAPGWGNCNSSVMLPSDDGCETYLDSLTACLAACGGTVVDCDATSVCNLGTCGPPQGLAVLTVPLTATAQAQRYGELFPGFPDLTNVAITVRLYAPGATGGNLLAYFTDVDFTAGGGGTVPLVDLAAGWVDLTYFVGGPSGDYDPTSIRQLNLVVTTDGTAGPWTNPTVVYIDGVRSSNLVISDTFNTSTGNMAPSTQQVLAGSTLTWSDRVP